MIAIEPQVRSDRRCLTCKGVRGRISKGVTGKAAKNLAAMLALDPFCSTACCRAHYQVEIPAQPQKANAVEDEKFAYDFSHPYKED